MGLHRFDKANALDQLAQLAGCHRSGHVGAEHLAAQCDVYLQHFGAKRHRREGRIHLTGVIGEPRGTAIALPQEWNEVDPHTLRRTRVYGCALQDGEQQLVPSDLRHGRVDLVNAAHARRKDER